MNSDQAAAELGISPRSLRRFMRAHPEYARVGFGGRYVFDADAIEVIREQLPTRGPKEPPELAWLDQTPGFTMEQVSDPRMKQQVLQQRRERQARLNERLKQLGAVTVR